MYVSCLSCPAGDKMSDRRFGFGGGSSSLYLNQSQSQSHNRCALCVTEDDRNNVGGPTTVCQHNASVESALHYLRNYGAPLSPSYGGGSAFDAAATASAFPAAFGAAVSPPVSPNYYSLAELLLRMNRMQLENGNSGGGGGHGHYSRPPYSSSSSSRQSKPKSEMGCLRECAFCKSNGETAEFYKSHFLKDPVGRVRCPILQRYVRSSTTVDRYLPFLVLSPLPTRSFRRSFSCRPYKCHEPFF